MLFSLLHVHVMSLQEKKIRVRVKPSALFKVTCFCFDIFVDCLACHHQISLKHHVFVFLLQPSPQQGNLLPDPRTTYQLYDRVVNVSTSNAIPFGLRGTIIGVLGGQLTGKIQNSVLLLYKILLV